MALVREQAVHTYASTYGGLTYRFDVVVDARGLVSVRNIQTSFGLLSGSYTSLPSQVVDDIAEARGIATQQLAERDVVSGVVTFAGDVAVEVPLPEGELNTTDYRVVYTTPDGSPLRTSAKTTASFTAEAPVAYGTADAPVEVGYTVLVSPQQTSALSGVVEFTEGSVVATVNFPAAMSTAAYRVVLTPDGFFPVRVSSRTRTKMVIELGFTPLANETVTVGYDIFV